MKGVGRRTKSAIGAINSIIVVGNSRYGSCIFFPRLKKAHLSTCIRTNEKLPRDEGPPIRYQILRGGEHRYVSNAPSDEFHDSLDDELEEEEEELFLFFGSGLTCSNRR